MSCSEANASDKSKDFSERSCDVNLEKLDELTNKLNRCNKNIKLVLELLQKMNEATEKKTQSTYIAPNSAEFENKRAVYLTKLNNKEIKQPKQTTLKFYEIEYDEDEEKYVNK